VVRLKCRENCHLPAHLSLLAYMSATVHRTTNPGSARHPGAIFQDTLLSQRPLDEVIPSGKWVICERRRIDHSALVPDAPNPGLPRPSVNIPAKPVLSAVFKDHVASLEHAHVDKHIGGIGGPVASAFSSRAPITSIPIPIEVVVHRPATSAKAEGGTLVSSGWLEGR
jgi:hypothetical protein